MPAYLVAQIEVRDPAGFVLQRRLASTASDIVPAEGCVPG